MAGANLDVIRRKLEELNSSSNKTQYIWKPKKGTSIVRIVPLAINKEYPFIELYFHYNIGNNKQMLSLFTFGEEDPIVEFAKKLQKSGVTDEWKLGKNLEPKLRVFAPIIVRGEEEEGVKFWGFGKTVYKELLSIMSDEDYDDITHLKTGRDITVEFVSPQEAKNTFGQISVRVKPKQTPISDKKEIIELVVNNQPDIFEIFKKPSKEELQIALDSWLNPNEDDSADNNSTDEKKSSSANKSTPSPTKNRDIDAALSELLGDD